MPDGIRVWIEERCYDCHSHRTRWPWYSYVAPLSWWMSDEVRRGRAGLNFSLWWSYSPRQRALAWRRSLQRIQEGRMPPRGYLLMHPHSITPEEVKTLEEFVKQQELSQAEALNADELMAWPARPIRDLRRPLTGVFRLTGRLDHRLDLQGALILADGDLDIPEGVTGAGAIFCTGNLSLGEFPDSGAVLALVSRGDMRLQGGNLRAFIRCGGRFQSHQLKLQTLTEFTMPVAGVQEALLEFCRDDGELGERIERQVLVRYSDGQFVLWDPEFQRVEKAAGVDQALLAAETLMKADPATSVARWRRRFRKGWEVRLRAIPKSGQPARLKLSQDNHLAPQP